MRFSKFAMAIVAVSAAGILAEASAQTVGPDFAKQRVEYMRSMIPSLQAFRKFASGEDPNAATVAAQASTLASRAGEMNKWFPPGTDHTALQGSRAKPEVWTNKVEFDAAWQKLVDEAEKLASIAATGDADAIKAQIAVVGPACGGCHGGQGKTGGKFRTEAAQ